MKKIAQYPAPVRVVLFLGLICCLWLPWAMSLRWLLSDDENLANILTMSLLFIELLWFWRFWGWQVHRERHIFDCYGLIISLQNFRELARGFAIGGSFCLSLFVVKGLWGLVIFRSWDIELVGVMVSGLLSAVGIGLAEELLFRGWLQDELRRNYGQLTVITSGSLIFALAHFLKPWAEIVRTAVTFPALFLLGIALALARLKHGDRLGFSIGLHGGLVWSYYVINVGELVSYTGQAPEWITGIDGNPIAGLLGIGFLLILIIVVALGARSR